MISGKLKNALLMAAIKGNLTQQNFKSESSSSLLTDIQNELENVKKRPLKNIIKDDDFPFDIPENWTWIKLASICKTIKAGGDKPKDTVTSRDESHPFPVIAYGINNEGVVGFTSVPTVNEASVTVSGRGTIGYSMVRMQPFFPIVRLIVIIPSKLIDINYLSTVIGTLLESGVGTSIKQLTVPMISNKLIPIPPIEEQKRIVEKLEELLPLIGELEKDEVKLKDLMQQFPENMKASILQAAIQGILTNQLLEDGNASLEFEEHVNVHPMNFTDTPFEIPDNWIFEKLGSFVSVVTGTSYKSGNLVLDGIRILRGGNVIDKIHSVQFHQDDIFIKKDLFDVTKQPKENDIVIVASTGSKTVIGKPAFIDKNLDNVQIGAFLRIIRPKYSKYAEYLRLIFMSKYYRNHITNTTQGTNINNISKKHIEDLLIPIPPLSEQKRIIEKVKQILPIIAKLDNEQN